MAMFSAPTIYRVGLNNYQYDYGVCLRYMILQLSSDSETVLLAIIEHLH